MITTTENLPIKIGAATLDDVQKFTKDFADEHDRLAKIVSDLNAESAALQRKYLPTIRAAVGRTAQARLTLFTAIEGSKNLFEKPRTQIFHGVKVGFMKGKGGIEIEDEDKTLALIRKTYGKDADAFILTKEVPDKKMLSDLTVTELKKLGCTVGDTGDKVVIRPTDSEIEKTVAALLKDATETEEK
jgi:hypothetical protein